ncbi:hypothetical protein L207DRAFT_628261 [Hyaloscypha variabilis F]|uniref:Mid2 domain-containing protein n=1 Tax=Hyaloscypha variabilis (strain UAMH 11265 / GT02V1 / F) TaxID=1149755 RepID=A0A2J6SA65_HYAVF|nr:hypothetical protein L207DRAFT_628261 [Hyaloscypha variabilis F]
MTFSLRFSGFFAAHLISITFAFAATNTCYFPDGNIASEFVPCSPNEDGGCCVNGDFCTEWGYCISDSKGYHYRGACTDTAWLNPSCPKYCLADTNSGNSTFVNVIACNAASNSGSWCCAYDGNCCSASTFVPSFGTIFAEPGASSTTAAASTPTLAPSATTSLSNTAAGAAASSSQTLSTLTSNPKTATGTIVAAVLCGLLGLAAVAGFGLFAVERKKRLRMEAERSDQTQPEMKPESSQLSEQKFLEIKNVPVANGWSQSDFLDHRHELSTQNQVTSELPTGVYGR